MRMLRRQIPTSSMTTAPLMTPFSRSLILQGTTHSLEVHSLQGTLIRCFLENCTTERTALQDPAEGDRDAAAASKPSKAAGAGGKQASARAAERQARKAQEEADRQRRAELELLLMDDSALQDMSKLGEHPLPAERHPCCRPVGSLRRLVKCSVCSLKHGGQEVWQQACGVHGVWRSLPMLQCIPEWSVSWLVHCAQCETPSPLLPSTGRKAVPEAAQKSEAPQGKLSHKARVAAKRAARAAKRGAASDDEDVAPKAAGMHYILLPQFGTPGLLATKRLL